jgi:predicted amidophosphoribosyltransferase
MCPLSDDKSPLVLEPEQEKSLEPSGPRIRCPLCGWSPRKDDRWSCSCGNEWNTFDTGGVCPSCLHHWTSTQCPKCDGWSPHSDWYAIVIWAMMIPTSP